MNQPNIESFQAAVEVFCGLATGSEPLGGKEGLGRVRDLLLQLIFHVSAAESHRHSTEHDAARIDEAAYASATQQFSQLPLNFYRLVFDPLEFESSAEPVLASLTDDLADIYRDLAEGLENARRGHLDDACFDWAFSYRSHWCRHAVGALGAIEIYRTERQWQDE